jgi:hypothetical protein
MDDDEPYSFESFIRHRPVFRTIEKELEEGGLKGLTPIDRVDLAEGMAVSDPYFYFLGYRADQYSFQMKSLKW